MNCYVKKPKLYSGDREYLVTFIEHYSRLLARNDRYRKAPLFRHRETLLLQILRKAYAQFDALEAKEKSHAEL